MLRKPQQLREIRERVGGQPFLGDGKLQLGSMCRHLLAHASQLAQLAPRQTAVELMEWHMTIIQESFHRESTLAHLMIGGYLLNDTVTVQTAQITVDVGNNLFLGFLLKANLTTEWGVGEATLYLVLDVARMATYQRLETLLIAKLGTRVTHKVEHGQVVLALMQSQATPKLL